MSKSRDAFRTISEVAEWLDTPAHVLRFWESKFSQVRPIKRAGGRRYYRPADMALLAGIKKLLHEDGLTIKGAQKVLREQGVKYVSGLSPAALDTSADLHEGDAPYVEVEPPEPEQTLVSFAEASAARASVAQEETADDLEMPAVDTTEAEPAFEPADLTEAEATAAQEPPLEETSETVTEWATPSDETAQPAMPEPAEAESAVRPAAPVAEMPPVVSSDPDDTPTGTADRRDPGDGWTDRQRDMFDSPAPVTAEPEADATESPAANAELDTDAVMDPQLAADMDEAATESTDERSEVFATGLVVEDMPPPEEPSATSAEDDTPFGSEDSAETEPEAAVEPDIAPVSSSEDELETALVADFGPDEQPSPAHDTLTEAAPEPEPVAAAHPDPQPLAEVPLTAQQRAERIMAGAHPHSPGPLSLLDRVERLTPDQQQSLRAALPRLQALHDRLTAPQG